MRAARSDSLRMVSRPRRTGIVERRFLREPLGPAQNRGQRVVELVGDAGNRLAERRHFLGLQQLMVDVARFIVQLLALADVAHERFDAERAVRSRRVGAGGELDPYRRRVRAPQPEQVVGHGPVRGEPFDERGARLRIDEALAIERTDVGLGRFARVAEDQLEMGVGGDGRCGVGTERPDVHPFADRLEQPRERRGASVHAAIISGGWRLEAREGLLFQPPVPSL